MRVAPAGRARPDSGFTLIEFLVSLGLIGTVMAALLPFLVRSAAVVGEQRGRQAAIRLADDALERAAGLVGREQLAGRGYAAAKAQWDAVYAPSTPTGYATAVSPYLATISLGDPQYAADTTKVPWLAWDLTLPVAATSGAAAPLPTTPVDVTVDGVHYQENWYLGVCREQFGTGGDCLNPTAADPDPSRADVPLLRVVVAVSWPGRSCAGGVCAYVGTTLSSATSDLVFNLNRPAPTVDNPGAQTCYAAQAISGLQLTATGGQLPLSWSFTGLPPGLTGSASGLVTGTPADPGTTKTYTVMATVLDKLGRTASASFSWTVVPAPVVSNPGDQSTRSGTAASLTMAVTGGATPVTWSASGLPAGLSINASTGVISGTPTATSPLTSAVTVGATDNVGRLASVTFNWGVTTLFLAAMSTRTDSVRDTISFSPPAPTGGTAPYTYRMINYPGDDSGEISINASTGVISGKVWYGNRYFTTVYVKDATGTEVGTTFLWNVLVPKAGDLTITVPDPSSPDQTSQVGKAVSLTTDAPTGSSSAFVWSAKNLPPGLCISGTGPNGYITGTPTTAGTYRVTLRVQDSAYIKAVLMFDWTVTP